MQGKKFRFSLASILRLRQHETERTKQDLAKKIQDRVQQEKEVSDAREVLAEITPAINTNQPVEIGVNCWCNFSQNFTSINYTSN